MFCNKCKAELKKGSTFCTKCGEKAGNADDSNKPKEVKQRTKKGGLAVAIIAVVVVVLAGAGVGGYYFYKYWTYGKASEALAKEVQPTWNETLIASKNVKKQIASLKSDLENKKTEDFPSTAQSLAAENAKLKQQLEAVKAAKAADEAAAANRAREAEVQKQIQEAMIAFYESYYSYMDLMQQVLNDPLGVSEEILDQLVDLAAKAEANYDTFVRISGAISGDIDRRIFDLASDIIWMINEIKSSDDLINQIDEEEEAQAQTVVTAFGSAWVNRDYDTASTYMTENFKADSRIQAWAANPARETSTSRFEVLSSEKNSTSQYTFHVAEHLDTGGSATGYFVVIKTGGKWLIDQVS